MKKIENFDQNNWVPKYGFVLKGIIECIFRCILFHKRCFDEEMSEMFSETKQFLQCEKETHFKSNSIGEKMKKALKRMKSAILFRNEKTKPKINSQRKVRLETKCKNLSKMNNGKKVFS